MIDVIRLILLTLPFLLCCLWGVRVNLDREIRNRQVFMPIIGLIYCVLVFIFLGRIYNGIFWLLDVIPQGVSAINQNAGSFIQERIGRVNWEFWVFYIINPVILVLYYLLKKFLLLIFAQAFKHNSNFFVGISNLFYEMDQETNIWGLQKKYGQLRTYYRLFFYSTVFLLTALFMVSRWFFTRDLVAIPFYPAFGVLIIGELYFYLNGMTLSEYRNEFYGEDDDAVKVVNYSLMRKYLRRVFGDYLTTENTLTNSSLEVSKTNDELIQKLTRSEDSKVEAFGKYIEALNRTGAHLEHSYIHSALEMLGGKSILFNNPFYNDLIPYISYPMNRTLLRHKKVMVIIGRHGIEEDIQHWITEGICAVTNIPTLWRVGQLTEEKQELDIGIITRSNVHNLNLHEVNREFFSQVEFVVIIEPSKLVSTAQIGLNSLVKYCRNDQRNIVFSSCDKNCDGLVDALSHILMTNLSEVSATNKHIGSTSYMGWDYDSTYWQHKILPNISRYLGVGTELQLAALKNQIGKAKWFGGEAYPVVDQLWINRQYYYDLLKPSGFPNKQEEIVERMQVTPNFWSAQVEENSYMIVEDESNNLFEMIRSFTTRATEQGFVNVISGEYLLKDYMADNAFLFSSDPKAIPYIVADYARTNRNVILRLLLMLAATGLTEKEIEKELSLMRLKTEDVKEELWSRIQEFYLMEGIMAGREAQFDSSVIELEKRFSVENGRYESIYRITDKKFLALAISELQNAGYLAEDEKGETHYLGAELRSHVFQRHLPGQFLTFNGKYYEMCGMSGDGHVLVRRAADHIKGRPYYRQLRQYTIKTSIPSTGIGDQKNISGMILSNEYAEFQGETLAYLDMSTAKDFKHAKVVKINDIPLRNYHNKRVLRIEMPNITDEVRYTLTFLLNEVFATVFSENHPFIIATTSSPPFALEGEHEGNGFLTYTLEDNSANSDSNSIYIIEDSQIDLGLLIATERNFKRILEIICDYLDWHMETVAASENEPLEEPASPSVILPEEEELKKGFFGRLVDKIKNLFKPKKTKDEGEETEDLDKSHGITEIVQRIPYHHRHFLLLGGDSKSENIAVEMTKEYLTVLGFGNSSLKQARDGKDIAAQIEASYNPNKPDAHYCDFCGVELIGTEYEVLKDGRERCMNCGSTAVKTKEEFTRIFEEVKRNMEAFYGIKFNCSVRVEMVNSRTLHKRLNRTFIPTNQKDPRILGVAIQDRSGFSILIENGSPRLSSIMTIAHELTHIWQFVNWDRKAILARYGPALNLEIYEGMAKWVEIQYTILINEVATAKREEMITASRDDEYGRGFLKYLERYSFSRGSYITKETPFMNKKAPL